MRAGGGGRQYLSPFPPSPPLLFPLSVNVCARRGITVGWREGRVGIDTGLGWGERLHRSRRPGQRRRGREKESTSFREQERRAVMIRVLGHHRPISFPSLPPPPLELAPPPLLSHHHRVHPTCNRNAHAILRGSGQTPQKNGQFYWRLSKVPKIGCEIQN